MNQLYVIFFQMAVCIILGFALRKARVIDERSEKTMSEILSKAILPFSILASSQYQYSREVARGMAAVAIVSGMYYLITLIAIGLIMKKSRVDDSEKRVMHTSMVFANTGFLGMPLMYALFGSTGLLFAAIYNLMYNLFFYTMGVHILSREPKFKFRGIFINAVSISSIASIVLFLIPWRMPAFITDTLNLVGNMTTPLAMIVLGSIFVTVDFKRLFTDVKPYIVILFRMIIFPALMFIGIFAFKNIMGGEILSVTATSIVLITALPVGTMNVIYSEKFNTAPKFAAKTVILSTFFMIVILPIIINLCAKFL